jgi:hypothetical protein
MKIQIDTTNKVLKIEESVNLKELFKIVQMLLPSDWEEYKLEVNTIIVGWQNPIIVEKPYPVYPWYQPYYTTGTFNVDLHSDSKVTITRK